MENAKKHLQFSLVGLFTFPYFFIIICGLLCLKYPFLYRNIDSIIIMFVILLVFFMTLSYILYQKYDHKYKSEVFNEEEIDEDITVTNIIGYGSIFHGDIETCEDVLVEGTLTGNIHTSGNVFVGGNVNGDVNCLNIAMNKGTVLGNVTCKEQITMDEESTIKGNLTADEILLPGNVEGDVCARKHLVLAESTTIIGDVECVEIEHLEKASIQGNILQLLG